MKDYLDNKPDLFAPIIPKKIKLLALGIFITYGGYKACQKIPMIFNDMNKAVERSEAHLQQDTLNYKPLTP